MGNELTAQQKMAVERKTKITSIIESGQIANRLQSLFSNDEDKRHKFQASLLNIALDASLQSCSPESIVKSALMIAELDLPLAKGLGQAYIVRYKQDAEAQIGYKGWLALAERANKSVKAKPIFKCDEFDFIDNGFDELITFKPNFEERREFEPKWVNENLTGVLVAVRDNSNGVVSATFVSIGKLKQISGVSPSIKAGKYSPYTDWGLEMYQGKALKYVLSKTAMNEQIGRAVALDNVIDTQAVESVRAEQLSKQVNLNDIANGIPMEQVADDEAYWEEKDKSGEVE